MNIGPAVDFCVQLVQQEPEELLCILLAGINRMVKGDGAIARATCLVSSNYNGRNVCPLRVSYSIEWRSYLFVVWSTIQASAAEPFWSALNMVSPVTAEVWHCFFKKIVKLSWIYGCVPFIFIPKAQQHLRESWHRITSSDENRWGTGRGRGSRRGVAYLL